MGLPSCVVFLNGPVGVGKTTLGRGLAATMGAGFMDGDDYSDSSKPWYCSTLQCSKAIVRQAKSLLQKNSTVIVSYPIRCSSWIYYRRHFSDDGIETLFVSLRASFGSIVDHGRGRLFDEAEQQRIQTMIAEGYGDRPFSDLILDTDKTSFEDTLRRLTIEIERMMPKGR